VLYTVKVAQRAHPGNASSSSSPPPVPQSSEHYLPGSEGQIPAEPRQYTISKQQRHQTYIYRLCRSFGVELSRLEDVDSHLYKPSKFLSSYLNWTFHANFPAVFFSFLAIFIVLCLLFAGLLLAAGEMHPDCIVVSGKDYGTNPSTKFGDSFALSWTTFTTVGYGNTYPATGEDFDRAVTVDCAGVVFLCTLEAFLGLIYAGMCAAIMFGKVNRVQAHAHLSFANAVCLQYEDVETKTQFVDDYTTDSDCDEEFFEGNSSERKVKFSAASLVNSANSDRLLVDERAHRAQLGRGESYRAQFKGSPVLKFQVVNDLCNKAGGEIVDATMKVVGIKLKYRDGKVTHTQYVRVNLQDFEHPFFGRVWHGVHVLDGTSPLLTNVARQMINANGGSWPENWFASPIKIRKKLDFQGLVVTVSGLSNVSASSVYAYKRYKFEDVIIGFDFAPLVYENEHTGKLEVDLGLVNDVQEQQKGHGDDLLSTTPTDDSEKVQFSRFTSSRIIESGKKSCTAQTNGIGT